RKCARSTKSNWNDGHENGDLPCFDYTPWGINYTPYGYFSIWFTTYEIVGHHTFIKILKIRSNLTHPHDLGTVINVKNMTVAIACGAQHVRVPGGSNDSVRQRQSSTRPCSDRAWRRQTCSAGVATSSRRGVP